MTGNVLLPKPSPKPRIWLYEGVFHCATLSSNRIMDKRVGLGFSPYAAYNEWWDMVWPANFPRAVAPRRMARGYAHVKPE